MIETGPGFGARRSIVRDFARSGRLKCDHAAVTDEDFCIDPMGKKCIKGRLIGDPAQCPPNKCECPKGTPTVGDAACPTDGANKCAQCDKGYSKNRDATACLGNEVKYERISFNNTKCGVPSGGKSMGKPLKILNDGECKQKCEGECKQKCEDECKRKCEDEDGRCYGFSLVVNSGPFANCWLYTQTGNDFVTTLATIPDLRANSLKDRCHTGCWHRKEALPENAVGCTSKVCAGELICKNDVCEKKQWFVEGLNYLKDLKPQSFAFEQNQMEFIRPDNYRRAKEKSHEVKCGKKRLDELR
jgi:hypothetical protein